MALYNAKVVSAWTELILLSLKYNPLTVTFSSAQLF